MSSVENMKSIYIKLTMWNGQPILIPLNGSYHFYQSTNGSVYFGSGLNVEDSDVRVQEAYKDIEKIINDTCIIVKP